MYENGCGISVEVQTAVEIRSKCGLQILHIKQEFFEHLEYYVDFYAVEIGITVVHVFARILVVAHVNELHPNRNRSLFISRFN